MTLYDNEGVSLHQYLSRRLIKLAHTPTLGDVLNQIARRSGGKVGFDTAVRDLAEERGRPQSAPIQSGNVIEIMYDEDVAGLFLK